MVWTFFPAYALLVITDSILVLRWHSCKWCSQSRGDPCPLRTGNNLNARKATNKKREQTPRPPQRL